MATLLADTIWEGESTEVKPNLGTGGKNGHFFKEQDTGEMYHLVDGTWEFVNLGFAFIKATKSGSVTTDSNGDASVVFNTPFIDTGFTLALTCTDQGGLPLALVVSKQTTGFTIVTKDTRTGLNLDDITVSWLATRDYNP